MKNFKLADIYKGKTSGVNFLPLLMILERKYKAWSVNYADTSVDEKITLALKNGCLTPF